MLVNEWAFLGRMVQENLHFSDFYQAYLNQTQGLSNEHLTARQSWMGISECHQNYLGETIVILGYALLACPPLKLAS
jgi:hypothetical protein